MFILYLPPVIRGLAEDVAVWAASQSGAENMGDRSSARREHPVWKNANEDNSIFSAANAAAKGGSENGREKVVGFSKDSCIL
jgi:hypothetical protein